MIITSFFENKRFLRFLLAYTIVMLALLSMPQGVRAESGNILISDDNITNFTRGGTPFAGILPLQTLFFDNISKNYLSSFRIDTTTATYGLPFESTPFTFTSGATGSGYISYDRNLSRITIITSSDSIITSNTVDFSMTKDIFANISFSNYATCEIQTIYPVALKTTGGVNRCVAGSYNDVVTAARGTDSYDVSYVSNLFFVNVTKSSNLNTKYFIHGQTSSYSQETTFNKINITGAMFTYNDGIYLNATLSSGAYTNVLVNASGAGLPTTPETGSGGSPTGQVYYSFSSNISGSPYGINATIDSGNYSSFTTYYIYGYDVNGNTIIGFPITFNTQTYSTGRFWTFSTAGRYNATLKYCNLFDVTCSNSLGILHTMDTATILISPISYSYSVTTDKTDYQGGNTIRITVNNPSNANVYLTAFGKTGIITDIAWNTLILPQQTVGLTKAIPQNMPKGEYILNVATSQSYNPIVAQTKFNITTPSNTSNVLSVLWSENIYLLGKTGMLTSTSGYNISVLTILDPSGSSTSYTFPVNSTNYTMITLDEVGLWKAKITDSGNSSNFYMSNTTVTAGNPTDNETVASCMSANTYVCWDKRSYKRGEAYVINFRYKSSDIHNPNPYIQIVSPSNTELYNRSINNTFDMEANVYIGSISGNFGYNAPSGIYFAKLKSYDILGVPHIKAESATEVIAVSLTVTPVSTGGMNGGIDTTNNIIGSPWFWGGVIMIAFALAGGAVAGIIGFFGGFSIGIVFCFIGGFIPLWALFLFVIIVVIMLAIIVATQITNTAGD